MNKKNKGDDEMNVTVKTAATNRRKKVEDSFTKAVKERLSKDYYYYILRRSVHRYRENESTT